MLSPGRNWLRTICFGVMLCLALGTARAETGLEFFESHIRPLLIENCYECHSQQEGKIKGGLQLDLRKGWQTGGDSGPAVIPGDPGASLLIEAVRYQNPDLQMPPDKRLSDADVQLLESWILQGAPDPRDGEPIHSENEPGIDLEAGREFWAFQPIRRPSIPQPADSSWPHSEIDRFIRSAQEEHNVQPVADAMPSDLIRRVHYDLTGLPPSPSEASAFKEDPSLEHYARIVDRLLASERFGEKWGRHWLDLARYAESTGGGRSSILGEAWRYRKYVIDSFNADKPYDQFVREQIAGDLLPHANDAERTEQLVATGFLALGPKNLDLQDKELLRMNTVDEQIDTVGRTFMAMTLGCARCHDHKFDPVPTRDYYALSGIFRSTKTLVLGNVSTLVHQRLPVAKELEAEHHTYQAKRKALEEELKALEKKAGEDESLNQEVESLKARLKDFKQTEPDPLPEAVAVTDQDQPGDYHLLIRGNAHQKGDLVPRGFLQVIDRMNHEPVIASDESGRRELAEWLASPDNPLTARVYVNRLWHHLFGTGLVKSVDNFGFQGDRPTHPALLDHLASEFLASGWSTKSMIRKMVLSRTYRMSTEGNAANHQIDPANQLRWQMPRRRLPAEAIRDTLLVVSGQLKLEQVDCLLPESARRESALNRASLDVEAMLNPPFRSVYIPVFREEGLNPLLEVFDFANPSFTVGSRTVSTLPTQSLFLLNSPFVMEASRETAVRLIREQPDATLEQRLNRLYRLSLGRPPTREESSLARAFVSSYKTETPEEIWTRIAQTVFACVDFRYLK